MTASKGKVLIIDGDEWVATLLAKYLRDRGFTTTVAVEARDGFNQACVLLPDCIICNVSLPDIDGFWVCKRIRMEESSVARVPFVFVTDQQDKESRLQGFQVGADAYFQKPFTHEEVVAQVEALVTLARRMSQTDLTAAARIAFPEDGFATEEERAKQRSRIEDEENAPSSRDQGIILRGDIARMSIPTVLTMLEMEKRTGNLVVENDFGGAAIIYLEDGACIGGKLDETRVRAVELAPQVLEWKAGRFTFSIADHHGLHKDPPEGVAHLLLEATRIIDEKTANEVRRALSSRPPAMEDALDVMSEGPPTAPGPRAVAVAAPPPRVPTISDEPSKAQPMKAAAPAAAEPAPSPAKPAAPAIARPGVRPLTASQPKIPVIPGAAPAAPIAKPPAIPPKK